MRRKDILTTGQIYHVFNRSIAEYIIFNDNWEFERMVQSIKYYQIKNELKFSDFMALNIVQQKGFNKFFDVISCDKDKIVQIIAYCLMPTHIHLVLKQLTENGISCFMSNVLNSYTHFFNTKYNRKGPLWESRFKNILVDNDDQLLHLIRYVHLNPVTAHLIEKPEYWNFSSHKEYILQDCEFGEICQFDDILNIVPSDFRKFTNDQIAYQRELAKIKNLLMD